MSLFPDIDRPIARLEKLEDYVIKICNLCVKYVTVFENAKEFFKQ